MRNKVMFFIMLAMMGAGTARAAMVIETAEEITATDAAGDEADMDALSAAAVDAYDMDGSLFQQITDLEQEKVLMQLEKERAQLDLELDRLAAEKIKLHMEIDTLSGRAEQQQQEFETERAKLEAEAARLAAQKAALEEETQEKPKSVRAAAPSSSPDDESTFDTRYRLVNVIGAGNQLQATIYDLTTGQNKRVAVGKVLDGFTVKSISLDDGIVFVKGNETQTLNVTSGN